MKAKLRIPKTPEYLRSEAAREAPRISSFGFRPTSRDLEQLRASTRDRAAYKIYLRAWRQAGFPLRAACKLAGRGLR